MNRLSSYFVKLFSAEAAGLFGVALTIIYLAQTLRIIDVDTVRFVTHKDVDDDDIEGKE